MCLAVTWLKYLVAGFSPRRLWFDSSSVNVRFMVDTLALRQAFIHVFRSFLSVTLHEYSVLIFVCYFGYGGREH